MRCCRPRPAVALRYSKRGVDRSGTGQRQSPELVACEHVSECFQPASLHDSPYTRACLCVKTTRHCHVGTLSPIASRLIALGVLEKKKMRSLLLAVASSAILLPFATVGAKADVYQFIVVDSFVNQGCPVRIQ